MTWRALGDHRAAALKGLLDAEKRRADELREDRDERFATSADRRCCPGQTIVATASGKPGHLVERGVSQICPDVDWQLLKPEHMPSAHRSYAEWTPARFERWAREVGRETEGLV